MSLADAVLPLIRTRADLHGWSASNGHGRQMHTAVDALEAFTLRWNERRLAVLDRDIDAIIRTHAGDRRVAAWFHDTARALEEIDEPELAIDWARQGVDVGPLHQSLDVAATWCRLLQQHHPERPEEVLAAHVTAFYR